MAPMGPMEPTPPPFAIGRRLLIGGAIVATIAVIAVGSVLCVNAMAGQTVREQHSYRFAGTELDVDVAMGDVHILPGKAGQITVARRLSYGLRRPDMEERALGDRFLIRDRTCVTLLALGCHSSWLIQVPRHVQVVASTSGGALSASGLSSSVKLLSSSGRVSAVSVVGPLLLRSKTGAVTANDIRSDQVEAASEHGAVSITFGTAPSLVLARSESGQVAVVVPAGDAYRVQAASQEGSATVTAKTDPTSHRRIDARSTSGNVRVEQVPGEDGTPADG